MSEDQTRVIELLKTKLAASYAKETSARKTSNLLQAELHYRLVEAGLPTLPPPRTRKPKDPSKDAVPPMPAKAGREEDEEDEEEEEDVQPPPPKKAAVSAAARGKRTAADVEAEDAETAGPCAGNVIIGTPCPTKSLGLAKNKVKLNGKMSPVCAPCRKEINKLKRGAKKAKPAAAAADEDDEEVVRE